MLHIYYSNTQLQPHILAVNELREKKNETVHSKQRHIGRNIVMYFLRKNICVYSETVLRKSQGC